MLVRGAVAPNQGEMLLDGEPVQFRSPQDARTYGIETVYQTLAVAPALDIASNLYLGREVRKSGVLGSVFRMLDGAGMRKTAKEQMTSLGIGTLQNMGQAVESLSGGQRQAVAVARAAAFSSKVIILDEPTAALGVKESNQVLKLIVSIRERGLPVILISHNMPQVFEVADRIHIQRLGKRAGSRLAEDDQHGRCRGSDDRCDQGSAVSSWPSRRRPELRGCEVGALTYGWAAAAT